MTYTLLYNLRKKKYFYFKPGYRYRACTYYLIKVKLSQKECINFANIMYVKYPKGTDLDNILKELDFFLLR